MTNREAMFLKDKIDIALICLSHAMEEPMSAESYMHIAMDELELCGRYVEERQGKEYYVRELEEDKE